MTHDKQLIGGRTPRMGEDTLEILSEEAIKVYLYYLDQLKALFVSYIHDNFNSTLQGGRKEVTWR